jgi:D-sedoheptulose 7-phosphate isomerase
MGSSLASYYDSEFAQHLAVARDAERELRTAFLDIVEASVRAVVAGGKLVFFGNGGSAADAQHLATELTIRYSQTRPAISALALTTDTSALTAAGNDFGFGQIFARQVEALVGARDVVFGLSTSGRSANVLNALAAARERGAVTVGFTGRDGGAMPEVCDHLLRVPSETPARIQEIHILVGHMLCGAIEKSLGHVQWQ